VIGAQRRGRGRAQVLGATARHVLKYSPCRAIVVAGREAA